MKLHIAVLLLASMAAFPSAWAQQQKAAGVVASAELKTLVPNSYFYRGKSASVQIRNSAAIRTAKDRYVIAGLVDTAGYASNVAEKYQGLFITEVKLKIGDAELAPGEYGFGFVGEKFIVTDVAANEVLSGSSRQDNNLKHPVPLKITEESGTYRLYAGRKYVSLKIE